MNTKVIGGLVAAAALIGAYLFISSHKVERSPADDARESRVESRSSEPTFTFGSTTQTTAYAYVNAGSLVASTSYPVITGTSNAPFVEVVIYTEEGVGIVGTGNIPVVKGEWSYPISVALKSGYYKVVVGGGSGATTAILRVN